MTDNARSCAWFRVAVVYFAAAVALGIVMVRMPLAASRDCADR
jgi:hypothetical protein